MAACGNSDQVRGADISLRQLLKGATLFAAGDLGQTRHAKRTGGAPMLDLIVRGGGVVVPQGVVRCDLGINKEAIAVVAAPGTLADADAARTVDAAGQIVMPRGVDPPAHMRHPSMIPDGTILYTQGPDRVGTAALYGGTTTLIDFAYLTSDLSVQQSIEARDAQFVPKSCCDWAYHLMLSSEPPPTQFAELREAI